MLLKTDGFPTYHLANVVDDHLMGITHVIRAEEWISSLPKHVQLYRAFGWAEPVFCHLPLLRNADKSKISKRKNPVTLNYYRRAGYLPEAMLNYLALMGWAISADREEFTLDEFIAALRPRGHHPRRAGVRPREAHLDERQVHPQAGRSRELLAAPARRRCSPTSTCCRCCRSPTSASTSSRTSSTYARFFFVGEVGYDAEARDKLVAKKRTPADTAGALARAARGGARPAARLERRRTSRR